MPLPDIQLDDRTFEQLAAELKRRIPGYSPEWTDHNESDPGITLIELFAWLAEMIIWRLNRVPDKNFIKFLELIGIQLEPPAPAHAELTFTLSADNLDDAVLIPQGTRVALAEQVDGKPVIFETDDNLYAVTAKLTALQSFDSARYDLLTESNRVNGKFFFPFGPSKPGKDAAFYLGFDQKFPAGTHTITVHAFTQDLIEEGKGIAADLPAPPPPVDAQWEYWIGGVQPWRRLDVAQDKTASLTRSGTVIFQAPVGMKSEKLGMLQKPDDKALFWLRYHINEVLGAGYEIAPRLEDVLLNTIGATNVVTVTDELVGASDGTPNQVFRLANAPVLPDRFDLQVNEGNGFESWSRVDDFAGSARTDKHFTVNVATGEIAFGDGEKGRIPGRFTDPKRPGDDIGNITANYRWGGGARGNAGAKKITSLQSAVPYVDNVTNLRPASGGQDEETLDHAKERAPQAIRSRSRAVTPEDFECLAKQAPGARIRRAHTLPLHHPDFQPQRPAGSGLAATLVPVPGVVTVLVVPQSFDPKPMPRQDTLDLVARWLNKHRLVTTEIFVAAPKYRRVQIEARVIVKTSANLGQVTIALEQMLLDYFHPLAGGTDGTGWEFGGTISFSETYRRLLNTDGVARIDGAITTYVDDQPANACEDVPLNEDELVYSDKHKIMASYA
jgi:hypothetical protein